VEIAAIRSRAGNKISSFQSLVNPGKPVSPEAFKVNKISENMLLSAPLPGEIFPKFMDFSRGSCLCSYNAGFDLGFLNNELRLLGIDEIKAAPVVDILTMARRVIPGLESYALWFVSGKLGIKSGQEHRALSDAELASGVFYRLKDMLEAKEGRPVKLENIINI